jgi:hypothetical protein
MEQLGVDGEGMFPGRYNKANRKRVNSGARWGLLVTKKVYLALQDEILCYGISEMHL